MSMAVPFGFMPGKGRVRRGHRDDDGLERDRVARARRGPRRSPATSGSRAPDRRPSDTASKTRRPGSWRGSSRSSRSGRTPPANCPTMPSPAIACSPMCRCTGSPVPRGRRPTCTTRPPMPAPLPSPFAGADRRRGVRRGSGDPPTTARSWHNVTHWSDFDTGGHFAAMETPQLLVEDIRTFFATVT